MEIRSIENLSAIDRVYDEENPANGLPFSSYYLAGDVRYCGV